MVEKREMEGYLHCVPYAGDGWILAKQKYSKPLLYSTEVDEEDYFERNVEKLFRGLEGKKIRIVVEVVE